VGVPPTSVQLSSSVTSTSSSASTGGVRSRLSTSSSTAVDRKNTSRNVTCIESAWTELEIMEYVS